MNIKNNNYDFWKTYRKNLTETLKNDKVIEKNIDNIINMANKIGIKPTARYFNISPATVRNYIKKDL